jgi:hypothetical protein
MPHTDNKFIDDPSDEKLLRAFVTTALRVLSAVVNDDAPGFLPPFRFMYDEAKDWCRDNWNGFREAAGNVLNHLRNIQGDVWEKLHAAGLTLGHLRMKWHLWWEDLHSGIFHRIFRRLNSILKSLASAVALAECLAEYKEHVEMTMADLDQSTGFDATSLIDLDSAK